MVFNEMTTFHERYEISRIDQIYNESISRSNFASNTMKNLYDEPELAGHNCRGKKGKPPLSPNRLKYILHVVFQKYPLQTHETEKAAWAYCQKIMDASLRQLRN